MIHSVPEPSGERWWAHLYPESAVSRKTLTHSFAKASQERSRVEFRAFIEQLNGFSIALTKPEWGKDEYSVDGVRCMQAPKEESLNSPGWARVLDIYGRISDPLARYVVGYYPRLHDMRPRGFPKGMMDAIKDLARLNACTALRTAMLSGFSGRVPPLFDSKDHTAVVVVAATVDGRVTEADVHEQYAVLAYVNELSKYANSISGTPGKVLKSEPRLTELDVRAMADEIVAHADELRTHYAAGGPSIEECTATADSLLSQVDAQIGSAAREIVAIESAAADRRTSPGPNLYFLREQSEHFAEARESTRNELASRAFCGDILTEQDAAYMFWGRVNAAVRRERTAKRSGTTSTCTDDEGGGPTAPEPVRDSMSAVLEKVKNSVLDFRDEIPGGFGQQRNNINTAEFDIIVEMLDCGIIDIHDIQTFCKQQWPEREPNAVASTPRTLADNAINTIRWAVTRSGLSK
jgi:hypothetical protein